ncbi:cupin domain-containing protein [Microbacterium mangrovi]|nr:hypothetical protein [Microbacterium mangrovi]
MTDDVRNIETALSAITEHWHPRRLTGTVNTGDAGGDMTAELQELG